MERSKPVSHSAIKRPRLAFFLFMAMLAAHLLATPAFAIPFKILVQDREGRAVANATVTLLNPVNSETRVGRTDAGGWALINHDWPAGTSIRVQISASGQAPQDLPYQTRGTSGMTGVDDVYLGGNPVQMTPPAVTGVTIEVAVIDPEGQPLPDAQVTIPGLGGKSAAGGVASFGPYEPETFARKPGLSVQVSLKGYLSKMDYIEASALQAGTVRKNIQLKINPAEATTPEAQLKAAYAAAEQDVAELRAAVDLYLENTNRLLTRIQAPPEQSLGVSTQAGAELQAALKSGGAALVKVGQCRAAVQPILKAAENALGDAGSLPGVDQFAAAEAQLQLLAGALKPLDADVQAYQDRLADVRDRLQAIRAIPEKEKAFARQGSEMEQAVRKRLAACHRTVGKVDQIRDETGYRPAEYTAGAFWTTLKDLEKQIQAQVAKLNEALRLLHEQAQKIQGEVLGGALQSDDARRLFAKSIVALTEQLGSEGALNAAKVTYTAKLPVTDEDVGRLLRTAGQNGQDAAQLLIEALTGTRDRYASISTMVAERLKKIAQIEKIGPEKLTAAKQSGNTAAAETAQKELNRAAEVKPVREKQQERCAAALKILNPLIDQVKTQSNKPLTGGGGGAK